MGSLIHSDIRSGGFIRVDKGIRISSVRYKGISHVAI